MAYVVAAPYVTLKVRDHNDAWVINGYYAGATVPDNVDRDSLQHLLVDGMVVEGGTPAAELAVPAGTPVPDEEQAKQLAGDDQRDGRPSVRASKEDWVTYAVSRRAEGVSEDDARAEADAKSKADLIVLYGAPRQDEQQA